MAWYEILALVLSLSVMLGVLIAVCIYDYKYKIEKLHLDDKARNNIVDKLDNIYNTLIENNKKGE